MYEISVVIPVYNVEKTLKRCVDSVRSQNFENYEIILVDDGSTDNSRKMCDLYSDLENVRVIHKVNGGLGSARNTGIEKASGEYICFVDSDDWVEKNYLSKMYTAIKKNKAAVCICVYYYHINKNLRRVSPETTKKSGKEIYSELGMGNSIYNFAWNKLYCLRIIKIEKLRFSNRHCAEDLLFNCQYYKYVRNGCLISDELYNYDVNYNSLSNGRRKDFLKDMKTVYSEYVTGCNNFNISENFQNGMTAVLVRSSLSNFYNDPSVTCSIGKKYMVTCKKVFDIGKIDDTKKLAKTDYLISNLLKQEHFIYLHIIMKFSKIVKSHMSLLYNVLRNSVSGNVKR